MAEDACFRENWIYKYGHGTLRGQESPLMNKKGLRDHQPSFCSLSPAERAFSVITLTASELSQARQMGQK
jgi:hypothetical protein